MIGYKSSLQHKDSSRTHTMEIHKLFLMCTLAATYATAKQNEDWNNIFTLYPIFESENRIPLEQAYVPSHHSREGIHRIANNLSKREDIDPFQRGKLTKKICSSCCCSALYKPKNVILTPDIYVTVMEVSTCNSTCPEVQTCTKIASTIEWSKMGFPVSSTAVFTTCACMP